MAEKQPPNTPPITLQIPGPIKVKKVGKAVEEALEEKLRPIKTEELKSGDIITITVDDNGVPKRK